jgi:hypothetical protein
VVSAIYAANLFVALLIHDALALEVAYFAASTVREVFRHAKERATAADAEVGHFARPPTVAPAILDSSRCSAASSLV